MKHQAAILAIGSELLSGQIVNGNAAWLSARLADAGIDVVRQMTVDDQEGDIIAALAALTEVAGILLVTGGLGPTSDDLTRQAIAKWCGAPLTYDEASWKHIEQRFARFSRDVPASNRQQCLFPQGATVLTNAVGTANGFRLTYGGADVWVLPGPPYEVATLWRDHLAAALADRIPLVARRRLKRWRTIGKGESHLAELVEPLLAGSGADVAYRAHAPYVELKLRYPEADAASFAPLLSSIEATLRPWLYETDDEDVATELAQRLVTRGVVDIYDGATRGYLMELLAPALRDATKRPVPLSFLTSWEGHDSPQVFVEQSLMLNLDASIALAVAGFDAAGTWSIGLRVGDEHTFEERPVLYRGEAMAQRNFQAVAALTAKAWLEMLKGDLH